MGSVAGPATSLPEADLRLGSVPEPRAIKAMAVAGRGEGVGFNGPMEERGGEGIATSLPQTELSLRQTCGWGQTSPLLFRQSKWGNIN